MRIGVIADDLTGAGDAALAFRRAGFDAEVALWPASALGPRRGVWALSTESRGLPAPRARARVAAALRLFHRWKPDFIYKKIDSTLRGPLGPELDAFLKAAEGAEGTAFVPAFPAAGRTVEGGRLRVHGVPLHKTAFARDPRHPVRTDRVAGVLGADRAARVWIPDVADEAALRRAAAHTLKRGARTAVGSAGFAAALARGLAKGRPRKPRAESSPARIGPAPVLLVSGSAHPVSRAQSDARFSPGTVVVRAPLRRGDPARVLRDVVKRAGAAARRFKIRRFAVTGGETAAALARALKVRRWRVAAEWDRGAPLMSSEGTAFRTWWVVKPGGFGREDLWTRVIGRLGRM